VSFSRNFVNSEPEMDDSSKSDTNSPEKLVPGMNSDEASVVTDDAETRQSKILVAIL
jgi:hypothetical protein